jgi:Ca2+-transporting ATPase
MPRAAPQVSTVLGVAVPAEREDQAYTEGIAIWVAVLVVSLVGELCAAVSREAA